jgi:hypothetical protein
MSTRRNGFKWTVNEILSLQREYELLELTIQEIALKHDRTIEAILYKLYNENIIDEWHVARGYPEFAESLQENESHQNEDLFAPSIDCLEEVYEHDSISLLTERVTNLETSVYDINYMLTNILRTAVPKSHSKRGVLRQKHCSTSLSM